MRQEHATPVLFLSMVESELESPHSIGSQELELLCRIGKMLKMLELGTWNFAMLAKAQAPLVVVSPPQVRPCIVCSFSHPQRPVIISLQWTRLILSMYIV